MYRILFVLITFMVFASIKSDHLMLGNAQNQSLLHHHIAEYSAIPLMKRVKQYFYSNPNELIQAIIVYDNLNTKATVTITAGGIGYSYVNLRMKSERGNGLSYDIGIYGTSKITRSEMRVDLRNHFENRK